MSEPEAGSDLAALRCRGEIDGDHVVVNGEKTWNSMGDRADWCQLYVRTDASGRKHEGITCLLVDMRLPGIEARPIVTMAGDSSFSQLFFTDVRVPLDAVLGTIGGGWAVATTTLSNERAGVAGLSLNLQRKLGRVLAGDTGASRQELAQRVIEARCLELLARRSLAARRPGPEGSVIKLAWSQAEQALAVTAATGAESMLERPATTALLSSRSLSIAGGTTEVNKNIIAERVLGLPK
jgi:alkylation response protein AidB-like acyl-CoA dehydrogenase